MFKNHPIKFQWRQNKTIVLLSLLFLVMLFTMIIYRLWQAHVLKRNTEQAIIPIVSVIKAIQNPADTEIVLPGNVRAWHEAPIYSRANGYVKKWYVDIGDHVKKDQLLAFIETPELDAQLRQAEANLKVVIANNTLAQSTAARWVALLKTNSVSKQETDEKVNAANALVASVAAAQANRDRLLEMVSFEKVIAPFDGTITSRAIDIGALINAGNQQGAMPLFRIVQTNRLRVYVKIPQNYAFELPPNTKIKLEFPEHPGHLFFATLLRTAKAIDPTTHTLLAQFAMNNQDNIILPGGYVEAHFMLPSKPHSVRLPINALLFRAENTQVATLDKHNRVVLKQVVVARDFGREVEIDSGVSPGELVILNPTDSITNGDQVKPRM